MLEDKRLVERLVELNRDHRARMDRDASRLGADPARANQIAALDRASRASICNAMLGAATRFAVARGGDLLELGAGCGGDRDTLQTTFDANYVGIEVVPEVAERNGLLSLSIETLPASWAGCFRWIYCRHVMEHVIDADRAINRLASVLAPDGVIGAVTPHYFPDPEPAHITQLRIDQWMFAYRRHGLIPVYATTPFYACPEAHLVVVRRALVETAARRATAGDRECAELIQLLAG